MICNTMTPMWNHCNPSSGNILFQILTTSATHEVVCPSVLNIFSLPLWSTPWLGPGGKCHNKEIGAYRLTNDKKSLFTVTNVLFYFLHAILCHEHTNPLRTITERSFRHCCQGRPFLTEHCDVTTIDLWRHANAKYWYCDVIFVYCHCTRNLAQRRSSLVNNSREYRYLATRYSRLSV